MRLLLLIGIILVSGLGLMSCSSSTKSPEWAPGSQVHQDYAVYFIGLARAWELRDLAQQLDEDITAGRWRPAPSQEAKARRACQAARDYLFERQQVFSWYANLYEPDPDRLAADLDSRAADLRKFIEEGQAERLKKKGELVRKALIDALRGDSGLQ